MRDLSRESHKAISRRGFIGRAATLAAVTVVPRHVLGGPRHVAPSEKLNIAGIGVGGRGGDDLRGVEGENIVALCDVDWHERRRGFPALPEREEVSRLP